MSEKRMTDAELDAWMRRASDDMDATLDRHTDTEARLRELLREAGVTPVSYADDSSPAGEVIDPERT